MSIRSVYGRAVTRKSYRAPKVRFKTHAPTRGISNTIQSGTPVSAFAQATVRSEMGKEYRAAEQMRKGVHVDRRKLAKRVKCEHCGSTHAEACKLLKDFTLAVQQVATRRLNFRAIYPYLQHAFTGVRVLIAADTPEGTLRRLRGAGITGQAALAMLRKALHMPETAPVIDGRTLSQTEPGWAQ
jgi:hypothetical protein